jgi:hypothetical protein
MGLVTIDLTDDELLLLEDCVWKLWCLHLPLPVNRRVHYRLALERMHQRLSQLVKATPFLEERRG